MSRDDMKEFFDVDDQTLDKVLVSLESEGLVKLNRDRKGIALAKATYKGLNEAFPSDHYRWFPSWVKNEYVF